MFTQCLDQTITPQPARLAGGHVLTVGMATAKKFGRDLLGEGRGGEARDELGRGQDGEGLARDRQPSDSEPRRQRFRDAPVWMISPVSAQETPAPTSALDESWRQ
jgi:hypothetical protein